jgi:TfoX/Sxy family transcriptional regulator of competence genes
VKKGTGREPQESGGQRRGGRVASTPKWRAAPAPLVARFDHAVAALPEIQQRKMFGCPAAFMNGHMFAGVFQASLFVRLAEKDRMELIQKKGATPFAPMPGRVMREYVVLPPSIVESEARLTAWLWRALRYVASLPPTSRQ